MIEIGKIKDAVKRRRFIRQLEYQHRVRQKMAAQSYADFKMHLDVIERIENAIQKHKDGVPPEKIEPI